MHAYRTHTCGELRLSHAGSRARLSGWVHRKRDHGQLLFVDLRDHYGLTQCVVDVSSPLFPEFEALRVESVITVTGPVVERAAETVNPKLPTGQVELRAEELTLLSAAELLPLQVNAEEDAGEETRLRYRYLDLRRERMQRRIVERGQVIAAIRRRMIEQGFTEFQTPILTASSPEGARDYLVPSRIHPGKFYALPQAPQMFKQLLMIAGFDRYFQIAPCFRDEDARADRSPGEFYQLDFEMSFVTQEDVFAALEPVLAGTFEEFADGRAVDPAPFPRIPFDEAMLKYGSDKPDLRNPIEIADATEAFRGGGFGVFAKAIEAGAVVRAIPAPGAAARPRSFFDKLNDWARAEGAAGLGYVVYAEGGAKGPIAKNLDEGRVAAIKAAAGLEDGDAVFFVCDRRDAAAKFAGTVRDKLGRDLDLLAKDVFRFSSGTRRPAGSASPTTPSPCPRAALRRWRARTPSRSRPGSTTSSATASSCPRGRSGTICPRSWSRPSRSPAIRPPRSRRASPACSRRCATARRRTAARRRASTASSCCWPTSRTSARSSPSP
jgi:aspartyl-tRNA synthetase